MSTENQLAVQTPPKASDQLAAFLGIEKGMMLETLKAQCFKGKRPEEVTDSQLAAFISTANVLQVNPLIPGMLWAFPERNGGISPILGPDGVMKKLDEHIATNKLEGYECVVYPEDVTQKPTHAVATIHRKGARAATYTALFSEWVVGNSPVWTSKPRHMLWMRAIKQCARQVIHGLPMDAEEYAQAEMTNVTPAGEQPEAPAVTRPEPPKRSRKGAAAVQETVQEAVVVAPAVTTPEPVPAQEPAKTEPPKPADAPAPVAPAEVVTEPAPTNPARAFLKDGEEITTEITVQELAAININTADQQSHASIKARVSGGFVGEIYHQGGGARDNLLKPQIAAPWAVGVVLKATIYGKLNSKAKNPDGTFGKVQVFVRSVAPVVQDEAVEV